MNNRRIKWIAGIVILAIVLVLLGRSLYSKSVEKAIELALEQVLTPKSYTYRLGSTDYDFLKGNLSVKQVSLFPNTTRDSANTDAGQLVELTVDGVALKGMSILDVLFQKKLQLREIKIEGLNVHLAKGSRKDTSFTVIEPEKPTWLDSLQFMGVKQTDLDEIEIKKTAVYFTDPTSGDTLDIYTGNSLRITGLYFQAKEGSDFMKMYVDQLGFNLKNQSMEFPRTGYGQSYRELNFNAADKVLALKGYQFGPLDDPYELASSYDFGKDVYDASFPEIKTYGFRLRQLLRRGVFIADSIIANDFTLNLYRDHNLPKNLQRKRLLPSEGIDSLGVPILVAAVKGNGGSIAYHDYINRENDFMEAELSKLNYEIDNVVTKHFEAQAKDTLSLSAAGLFASEATFDIAMDFPYGEADYDLLFNGEVGPFRMSLVNPMVRPMEGIWFEEGYCNRIYFTSSCSESWCQGDLRMLYQDLKMSIEEQDDGDKAGIRSLLANIFIRKNNPVRNKVKVGDMSYSRELHMSMVNLVTMGLMKGVEDTVKP